MRLSEYSPRDFHRGRSRLVELAWMLLQALLVGSWVPGSWHRIVLLRLFGAMIGCNVVIKPGVRVKFPWRLQVGDHSWIGEDVWIDNLAKVSIGSHVCVSQGAYLCTGSHDWASESFDLITLPIDVADHAWIGSKAVLAPGTEVGAGAVLSMASFGKGRLDPWTIYLGIPAKPLRPRPRGDAANGTS